MPSPESDGIATFLKRTVRDGASSLQVAESVSVALQGIDEALTPIIGKRGVAALHQRTVHLARGSGSWLILTKEGVPTAMDFEALKSALAQQEAIDAADQGALILQTFHALLTTLVGPSLTERLLRPAWATLLSGPSAQDTTS